MTFISGLISYYIICIKLSKSFNISKKELLTNQLKFLIITIIELFILKLIFNSININNKYITLAFSTIICMLIPNLVSLIIMFKNNSLNYIQNIFKRIIRKEIVK